MLFGLEVQPGPEAAPDPDLDRVVQPIVPFGRPSVMSGESQHSSMLSRAVVVKTARKPAGAGKNLGRFLIERWVGAAMEVFLGQPDLPQHGRNAARVLPHSSVGSGAQGQLLGAEAKAFRDPVLHERHGLKRLHRRTPVGEQTRVTAVELAFTAHHSLHAVRGLHGSAAADVDDQLERMQGRFSSASVCGGNGEWELGGKPSHHVAVQRLEVVCDLVVREVDAATRLHALHSATAVMNVPPGARVVSSCPAA